MLISWGFRSCHSLFSSWVLKAGEVFRTLQSVVQPPTIYPLNLLENSEIKELLQNDPGDSYCPAFIYK